MAMSALRATLAAGTLALGFATAASAQTVPVQPQPRDPNMPGQQNTLPEKLDPGSTGSTGTLSDRLERSNGVIRPPSDDTPSMTVKPPVADPGTTRVFPGPGGGTSNVQPK